MQINGKTVTKREKIYYGAALGLAGLCLLQLAPSPVPFVTGLYHATVFVVQYYF